MKMFPQAFFLTAVAFMAAAQSASPSPASSRVGGLVGRWTFDEASGDTVRDVSGNDHHGLLTHAVRTDGISGSSLQFLDSGGVVIPRHSHFNTSVLSMVAWVRTCDLNADNPVISRRNVAHSPLDTIKGYDLSVSSGRLNGHAGSRSTTGDSLFIDRWYQVALTYNGQFIKLYINGSAVKTDTNVNPIGMFDTSFCIGASGAASYTKSRFHGSIDEVSFYDIALPADSIRLMHNRIRAAAVPDSSPPAIFLNKPEYNQCYFGIAYQEYGAQAWDGKDGNISSAITIRNDVNVLAVGAYTVNYMVLNSLEKPASVTRNVTVLPDTLPPRLSLKGDTACILDLNQKFIEPGYSVIDYPSGIALTDSVKATSDLDTTKAGTYTVTYTVTDFAGLKASASRKVVVVENPFRKEIWVNQIGYYPLQKKVAVVLVDQQCEFEILPADGDSVVYKDTLSTRQTFYTLNRPIRLADFSPLKREGSYKIRVRRFGHSQPFAVSGSVYKAAAHAALKTYYYQRSSTPISAKCGGVYAREAGHPDTVCPVFGDEAQIRSVPGGWYDAGDYGKYVVNGGITVGTLLSLYELYPDCFGDSPLNIPESNNGKSDLLDEIKWELDWFKTMQDTSGGVAFKVGPLSTFPPFIMPAQDLGRRFVIGTTATASTLNFAAVMAQAGRVFRGYDSAYAADCLTRAEKAWLWAKANPSVSNPSEGTGTGLYSDGSLSDEFLWAAAELYISTSKDAYRAEVSGKDFQLPYFPATWSDLLNLPVHSLACGRNKIDTAISGRARTEVLRFADDLLRRLTESKAWIFLNKSNYFWGSNGITANGAVSLGYAYYLTKNTRYLDGVIAVLDYLCGKNPTGYSFITGFGAKSPLHPHHRISGADNVDQPIPGFLVGGPNDGHEDRDSVKYPSSDGILSYVDDQKSYASNEVAINWTAPFLFAAAQLEAEVGIQFPVRDRPARRAVSATFAPLSVISGASRLHIRLNLAHPEEIGWTLMDLRGRSLISMKPKKASAGVHTFAIRTESISRGIYLLRISAGKSIALRKVDIVRP